MKEFLLEYLKNVDFSIPKNISSDEAIIKRTFGGGTMMKFGPREIFFDETGAFDGSGCDLLELEEK